MDGDIRMSKKELSRLEVVQAVVGAKLTQMEAAERLKLSVRQVKRLCRSYREDGAAGLVSKRRGQPSNHRIGEVERAGVIELIKARYEGFGPTLAAEYLREEDGYRHCVETLRGWMKEAGLERQGPQALRVRCQSKYRHHPQERADGWRENVSGQPLRWP